MTPTKAYPLQWPQGWRRLGDFKHRDRSRFNTSFVNARNGLIKELELFGAENLIISSNIPLNTKGVASSKFEKPLDTGVAVYFKLKDKNMVLACDEWSDIEGNFQSIRKTIGAIRGIERWAASDMLERIYSGFKQLEAPEEKSSPEIETPIKKSCWEVLGIEKTICLDKITEARSKRLSACHPDHHGSDDLFIELTDAYRRAWKIAIDESFASIK